MTLRHAQGERKTQGLSPLRLMLLELRLRDQSFPRELAQGPGFAMLLDLTSAEQHGRAISVTSICLGSYAPATTALRYLELLQDAQLVTRRADPDDGRRSFLELTDEARAMVGAYLDKLAELTAQVAV